MPMPEAKLNPTLQEAFRLAAQHYEAGRYAEAEAVYRRIISQQPDSAETYYNLAMVFAAQRKVNEAISAYQQSMVLRPGFLPAAINLGNLFNQVSQPARAAEIFLRALGQTRDDYAMVHNNLASALQVMGRRDVAFAYFDQSVAILPTSASIASNRLYSLHVHADSVASTIYREARLWNERFARPLSRETPIHANDPSPHRRLRIGYVSGDFRKHVLSLFTIPLLAHHDHDKHEIFCYSDVAVPDGVTAKAQRHADIWRDTGKLSDEAAAQLIGQDKIDILVDISLHMGGSRLLAFARKPAPIQVIWLGYPGTTGMDAIDYRITDPRLDPPGGQIRNPKSEIRTNDQNPNVPISKNLQELPKPLSHLGIESLGVDSDFGFRISDFSTQEPYYSERSVRLPDSFWCYDPRGLYEVDDETIPEPGPVPARKAGHITFGCLNHFAKVSDKALALWARVMAAVPNSHLLLRTAPGPHRDQVVRKLGVSPQRVIFVPYLPRKQYLEAYGWIDICLDTLPYNGHTTSLDAMWMGVPVVTRVGWTVVGRAGLSHMHNLNLMELVAHSDEQFVQVAAQLAGDLDRLDRLRATLRERMRTSPLMDGPRLLQKYGNTLSPDVESLVQSTRVIVCPSPSGRGWPVLRPGEGVEYW